MFNARRPPSYFKGEYTKAAEDVCPRPLYYLQFTVFCLFFTFLYRDLLPYIVDVEVAHDVFAIHCFFARRIGSDLIRIDDVGV